MAVVAVPSGVALAAERAADGDLFALLAEHARYEELFETNRYDDSALNVMAAHHWETKERLAASAIGTRAGAIALLRHTMAELEDYNDGTSGIELNAYDAMERVVEFLEGGRA